MKTPLSKVYLDDYPIDLMGDEARPPLSRIVRAGGKVPARVDIIWLEARSDPNGAPVDPDEFIDRTSDPTRPIYLRSLPRLPMPGEETVTHGPADNLESPATRDRTTPAASKGTVGPAPSSSINKPREIASSGPVSSHSYVKGPGRDPPTPDPVIAQLGKPAIVDADIAAARAAPVVTRRPKAEARKGNEDGADGKQAPVDADADDERDRSDS